MRFCLHYLCITAASLLLVGCAPSISTQDATSLSRELRPILDAMCVGGGSVSAEKWPASLVAIQPNAVRVTTEGLYAETWSLLASERGVFVACRPNEFAPQQGSDPSYHAVAAGV